jgi:hypothetical protein
MWPANAAATPSLINIHGTVRCIDRRNARSGGACLPALFPEDMQWTIRIPAKLLWHTNLREQIRPESPAVPQADVYQNMARDLRLSGGRKWLWHTKWRGGEHAKQQAGRRRYSARVENMAGAHAPQGLSSPNSRGWEYWRLPELH